MTLKIRRVADKCREIRELIDQSDNEEASRKMALLLGLLEFELDVSRTAPKNCHDTLRKDNET